MTQITAIGQSTREYDAERATIQVFITNVAPNREEAWDEAHRLQSGVLSIARRLEAEGSTTFLKAEAPTVSSYLDPDTKEWSYTVRSLVIVKLSDLERVSAVVSEITAVGDLVSPRVSWSLTEDSLRTLTSERRVRAVQKARDIAEDYASAIGENISSVVSIKPLNASSAFRGAVGEAKTGIRDVVFEITIPKISVSASVEVVYGTKPDSGAVFF